MDSPLGGFLRPEGFAGPRGLAALSREGSTIMEAARHLTHSRQERGRRAGMPYAGHHIVSAHEPVLLIPGFMASDVTLSMMGNALRHEGFRTYRSQIRVNVSCTRERADRLEERLEEIADRRGRKVSIVGHSLGGMLARGLAARRPDLVAGIVTMGSPVLAPGAVHGALAWDIRLLNALNRAGLRSVLSEDCVSGECAAKSFTETRAPLPEGVGFTAIYSRRDGIVDWRACRDPQANLVEVTSSHCGMAVDPVVLRRVIDSLHSWRVSPASRREARGAAAGLPLAASR